MASLRKRPKSDYWVCCYTTADGHRTQRSTGTMDKEEAMAVCRLWENEAVEERAAMEKAVTAAPAKDRRFIWAAAAIAVLLQIFAVYWLMKPDESSPVSLFVELDKTEEVPAQFLEQQFALRYRWVRINEEAFEAFDENAPEFMLNLFDNEKHRVDVAAYRKHYTGAKSVVGLVENDLHSSVVISRRKSMKGIIAGSIGLPDGRRFLVTHGGEGKHVIIEIDMAKAPKHSAHASNLKRLRNNPENPSIKGGAKGVGANDHLYDASEKPKTQMAKLDGENGASQFVRGLPLEKFLAAAGLPNFTNPKPPGSINHTATNTRNFYGRTGAGLTQGPTTPARLLYMRTAETEFIDVLFVYEGALLAQAGFADEADLQLKIDNLVEETNLIFRKCLIPLEVRQAILDPANVDFVTQEPVVQNNTLFLAKARAWATQATAATVGAATANIDGVPGQPIGASFNGLAFGWPAWREVTPPVKPVWQSTQTPPIWNPQPTMGVYEPLYETPTFAGDSDSALAWIMDPRNSLIYGDQYWDEPFINFPEGYQWMLLPVAEDGNASKNIAPYEPATDYSAMDYTSAENPDIRSGPIDDSPYGANGLSDQAAGNLEVIAEMREYVERNDGGSLIGAGKPSTDRQPNSVIYPLNLTQDKPNHYIRNTEDGNASFARFGEIISGTIDPAIDVFTLTSGTLTDGAVTAFQQNQANSLSRPISVKWVDFNFPQLHVRAIPGGKYTFYYNQADAKVLSLPGIAAHYPFSGNANDAANANNGTVTGATLTADRFGNANSAYTFAAGNEINLGQPYTPGTDEFSVSLWVGNATDPTSNDNNNANLIGNRATTNTGAWWLGIDANGVISFDAHGGTQKISTPASTFTFASANWDHIVMTRASDGNTTIYFNGTQLVSGSNTQNITAQDTLIAKTGASNEPYVGNMDDVRIFKQALTPAEVTDLYHAENNGLAPVDGFDQDSTYNVVTRANHGWPNGTMLESNSSSLTQNVPYYIEKIDDTRSYLRTTEGGAPSARMPNSIMSVTQRSGNRGQLGIDTFDFILPHGLDTGDQVFLAEGDGNSFPAITTEPLGDTNSTTVERHTHYDVYRWNPRVVSLHGIRNRTQTPEKAYFNIDGKNTIVTELSKTGDLALRAGELNVTENFLTSTVPTVNLTANYPFSGNANDATANANNGTVTGATLTADRFGNADSAYSFDGTNDHINFGNDSAHISDSVSLSVWFKVDTGWDDTVTGIADIVSREDDGRPYRLRVEKNTSTGNEDKLVFYVQTHPGTWVSCITPAKIDRNKWYHAVATAESNGAMSLYLNGVKVATLANIGGAFTTETTGSNLYMGRASGSGANWFHGDIDDLAIFGRILTESEVMGLYGSKPSHRFISITARPAPNANLAQPKRFWFADENSTGKQFIHRIDADGSITTVAGGGVGDPDSNGSATSFDLTEIEDIAVDSGNAVNHSSLYIAANKGAGATGKGRIYKVSFPNAQTAPDPGNGSLTLLAGSGETNTGGQAVPGPPVDSNASLNVSARLHTLGRVTSVATDRAGDNIWFVEQGGGEFFINRVASLDNSIVRVLGGGAEDPDLNASALALDCRMQNIADITIDTTGRLYFSDNSRRAIWRVDLNGSMVKIAGSSVSVGEVADGAMPNSGWVACEALVSDASHIYFGGTAPGTTQARVRRVPIGGGLVTTVAGGGLRIYH